MNITIAKGEEFMLAGVREHFAAYTGPLDVVVDIGAHVGELSIAAAERGAKTVIAVEADRENYGRLVENKTRSGYGAIITALNWAVWWKPGPVRIAAARDGNSGMRSVTYRAGIISDSSPVQAMTLEMLLRKTGPVDYLKMDIEGAEHWVIPATPLHVLRQIHALDLDVHDVSDKRFFDVPDHDPERLRKHLAQAGFVVPAGLVNGHAGILLREERP